MKKIFFILQIFVAFILFSGCSSHAFTMDTNPEGAEVNIINSKGEIVYKEKAPVKISSKHIPKGDYTIVLTKPGYEKTTALRGNSKDLKLKKMELGTRTLKKIDSEVKD